MSEFVSGNRPVVETLEPRLLLSLPTFGTPLYDNYTIDTGALAIGVDGRADGGSHLTITAATTSPDLTVSVVGNNPYARLHFVAGDAAHTSLGDIVVQLFADTSPAAANRFIDLSLHHINSNGTVAAKGDPFYHNVVVHRIVPNPANAFIQTGDALNGNGTGNSPLPPIPNPSPMNPGMSFAGSGVLAMANAGAGTSNSQFFITEFPYTSGDASYIIFGQVISGMDVLHQMISLPTDANDKPYSPPILEKVDILQPSQFNQAGVIHIVPGAGFTGSADVTVTLDDGVNTTTQTLHVHSKADTTTQIGAAPVIPSISDIKMPAGNAKTKTVTVNVADDKGADLDFFFRSSYEGAVFDYNPATKQLTVTVPASFNGMIKAVMSARESGWADRTPSERTFYIFSQPDGAPPVASSRISTFGQTVASQQVGDYLFQLDTSMGLVVYRVSNPAAPSMVASTSLGGSNLHDLQIVGNTAYVTAEAKGLISVDITDPTHPAVLATVPGDGTTRKLMVGLDIVGDLAYVSEYGNGLTIYNIQNPANITWVGNLLTCKPASFFSSAITMNYAMDVVVNGRYAYVTDGQKAIFVVDVSNPAKPRYVKHCQTDGSPWGAALGGGYLYVAQNNGLSVWNVSSPGAPRNISTLALTGGPTQLAVSNQTAVVNSNRGFHIVDISDPAHMWVEYEFTSPRSAGKPGITDGTIALPMTSDQTVLMDATDLLHRLIVHKKLTFLDDHQVPVTVSISGGGDAYLYTSNPGGGKIEHLVVPDPTSHTKVTLTTPAGQRTRLYDVQFDGTMGSFTAKTADLDGSLRAIGTIASITLGDVIAGSTIDVDAPGLGERNSLTIALGSVTDLTLTSGTFINSLTAVNWTDASDDADIVAPAVKSLKITGSGLVAGNFQGDLQLAGLGVGKTSLGSVRIAHDMDGSILDVLSGNIGSLTVGYTARNSTIRSVGSISSVAFGASDGTDLLAGVASDADRHAVAGQFADSTTAIKSFKITGWKVAAGQTPPTFFADSNISAPVIGKVTLKNIDYGSGLDPFGVWMQNPLNGKLSAKVTDSDTALVNGKPVTTRWSWPGTTLPQGDFDIQAV